MRLDLTEHKKICLVTFASDEKNTNALAELELYKKIKPRTYINKRNQEVFFYNLFFSTEQIDIQAGYFIGIDWILPGKKYIYVAPKINTEPIEKSRGIADRGISEYSSNTNKLPAGNNANNVELNYLQMYLDAARDLTVTAHIEDLVFIDWEAPQISIERKDDMLTPFLVVQFLTLLKHIVRKGLKKSYYPILSNLNGKIKGKILISKNFKTNIVKNSMTQMFCEYQEFGIDNPENRFLKKVLIFASRYISNNLVLFKSSEVALQQMIGYCSPAFEKVSDEINDRELTHIHPNPFFEEYKTAIKAGQHILKRFAYNISVVSTEKILTPPFWINMPLLFELYVYQQLLEVFPNKVDYKFSTYGNELDFLITAPGFEMVIDAKYKLHYNKGHIHEDIRQIAGYARLNKVYAALNIEDDRLVDCLIIYPDWHPTAPKRLSADSLKQENNRIKAYRNLYKAGVSLPCL